MKTGRRKAECFLTLSLFDVHSETGQDYLECLAVAGEYAYAGRDWVVNRILQILGNPAVTYEVHNHHNFAWQEEHFGEKYWVVRKGLYPSIPRDKKVSLVPICLILP